MITTIGNITHPLRYIQTKRYFFFCAIQNKCTHILIFSLFFLSLFSKNKKKRIAVIYKSHNKKKVNILHTRVVLERRTQQKRVLLLLTGSIFFSCFKMYFFSYLHFASGGASEKWWRTYRTDSLHEKQFKTLTENLPRK